MSTPISSQKVTKSLTRPSSGQAKKPSTSTASSKMEILPPEESKTATNFSKPQMWVKKEMKLERTGSAASKKSSTSVMSSAEVSGFDYTPERDLLSQSSRSRVENPQTQEDLKKISSKPFSTKSKQQPKKVTSAVAESNEFAQSNKSTNFDVSQPHILTTPGTDPNISASQALLSAGDDDNLFSSAKQRLDFTPGNVDDLLMYDDDMDEVEKEEENIELSINFEELHKKFEEMASRQKEIEMIAKDYVNHILNAKTDTGEALVQFPNNFQEIVDNTVEETKTMEELRDKGIVSDAGIQMFIQDQVRTSLNQMQKKKEEKEDPYAKEKEKIRELDRVLAQKEREIRIKKETEKMQRLQELQDFDEEEMSMDNIDKVFLTAWHKKRKSGVSTAQVSAQKEKARRLEEEKEKEKEKAIMSKPKIFAGKNHIKKNIQGAFSKAKDSLVSKLSEKDQQRLESFMAVINQMLDNEGHDDELLKQVVSNPYELGEGDAYRMQEIDARMALYSVDQNVKQNEDLIDKSKLPKDKALRDQAEKRALQDKNDAVTKKLMEINNKERLNEVCDPSVVLALVEKLKKEHAALGIDSTRKKSGEQEDDELERQFKEAAAAVSGFDTEEILQDLSSLSQQTQSVQKKLKSVMENMNSSSTTDERARKEKGKSALLDMYAARKDALDKLESNAVQNEMDALSKLEKKLFLAERSAIDAENRLRAELDAPVIAYEPEIEKTAEDYDREFTEKLRLQNPELFANMPEGLDDDIDIDPKYKDVIIEEWHDDEVGDENQEPR